MLLERHGKAGDRCGASKRGELRCPLILRGSSEDAVTDQLATALRVLNPRWWLPDLLTAGLGLPTVRRQIFRGLTVEPWRKQPPFPRDLLPWEEGRTEVDLVIEWENPPTTVFVEMKYGSPLSPTTTHNAGERYPSDQLARLIRVGLYRCGHYAEPELYRDRPRDFIVLVVAPTGGNPLVETYRDRDRLFAAIPYADRIASLPAGPFVGELAYRGLADILRRNRRWWTRAERVLAGQISEYLDFKADRLRIVRDGTGERISRISGNPGLFLGV